jgi:hypothetical protein
MGLRDRLRERQAPSATVALRIDASPASFERDHQLELVEARIKDAEKRRDSEAVAALSAELEEAQAAVDACYEYLTVKAIPASEMEALIGAHPATREQLEVDPRVTFNRLTFFPALLAACVESTETEEDWAQIIQSGELVLGEINTLVNVAMELNDRSPSVTLGKGSTPTRS